MPRHLRPRHENTDVLLALSHAANKTLRSLPLDQRGDESSYKMSSQSVVFHYTARRSLSKRSGFRPAMQLIPRFGRRRNGELPKTGVPMRRRGETLRNLVRKIDKTANLLTHPDRKPRSLPTRSAFPSPKENKLGVSVDCPGWYGCSFCNV